MDGLTPVELVYDLLLVRPLGRQRQAGVVVPAPRRPVARETGRPQLPELVSGKGRRLAAGGLVVNHAHPISHQVAKPQRLAVALERVAY